MSAAEPMTSVSSPVVQCKKPKQKRKRLNKNRSRKRGRRAGMRFQEQKKRTCMLKEVVPAFLSTTNPASTQRSSSPPLVDFTLPEEDIAELSPCPSPVELLVTDHCAKVWLSSKIPVEILNAHVRHHISGAGGVSPIVRSWCMDVFHQMYLVEDFPDVPSYDFNIHRLNSDSTL
ncbi:uncharacterized protein LOC100740331 [Bombus impatiens]|uniref:Uncharacterized protein LOC100740331 n=1 Tax=Bombus impatiens TaxID=132113 RepID=A0A6P3DT52_BOMIM|nr:uncharacterized protein LOC100740331 [Bombus impatiens]XP_012237450.1 uncharacterized protein LOC100740331 [Bombus impatiens]XP_024221335.1 uncharacterized protein LOC100740331 [Bombus impatiens]XP_033175101.1 uncharacterized protein LOC100740331 [Bombus impatiens]